MKTNLDAKGIEFHTKHINNKRLTIKQFLFCAEWLEQNYIRYGRNDLLPNTLELYLECQRKKNLAPFFVILGYVWQTCDNIAQYARDLFYIFVHATQKQQQFMMDDGELAKWRKLPDILTAYRFCYDNNMNGFCYASDKEEAELFSVNRQYQQEGRQKFIVTVSMPKAYTILKTSREQEFIATRLNTVKVIRKHKLTTEENEVLRIKKEQHHKATMEKFFAESASK
jgi:hypothetical protein